MADQEPPTPGPSNAGRWSRNLSARRHRQLERMNEMEKKRQLLEIRKQNDFFKQMSSAITGADSTTAESTGSTTIAPNQRQQSNLSPDRVIASSTDAHANTTADDGRAGRAIKPGSSAGGGVSAADRAAHNGRNKNLLGQTAAAASQHTNTATAAADTYQSQPHKQIDLDLVQSSSGVEQCKDQPAGMMLRRLDVLTREQVNQFVSVAVPKNKRVLCLIVRDKLTRLHQAKFDYYPIYYLFIQAIVDVDDGQYNGGAYRYYPDNVLAGHNAGPCTRADQMNGYSGSEQNAGDPTDNSFSASSSISADMMFIGAATHNHEANAGNIKTSGLSYSDNELCDDSGEHPGAGESRISAQERTMMLKNHIDIRSKASSGALDGHNRFDHDPSVYPDDRQMAPNRDDRRSSCSDAGAAAAAGNQQSAHRAAGDRVQTQFKIPSMIKSTLGLHGKSEEEEEHESEEDENVDENNDSDVEPSDQAHLVANKDQDSSREVLPDAGYYDQVVSKYLGNRLHIYDQQRDSNDSNPSAANKVTYPRADMVVVASLFDNSRNPYIETCGVLLSGRRQKNTKTYRIGLGEDGFMKKKNSICKLKSNVLGTQFSATRLLTDPESNAVVDKCMIASINYETNVLGFKGPRRMRVLVAKDLARPLKNISQAYKLDPNCVTLLKNMVPAWNPVNLKPNMLTHAKSRQLVHDNLASPPGYYPNLKQCHGEVNPRRDMSLIVKKSWEIAVQPLKQVPMNLFIMYMAGNSISIIPIMMVSMLLIRPIKALLSIRSKFATMEGNQAILQNIVYLIGNLASLALALYKCQSMGLLPTHSSDWLDFLENPSRVEYASGGFNLAGR